MSRSGPLALLRGESISLLPPVLEGLFDPQVNLD